MSVFSTLRDFINTYIYENELFKVKGEHVNTALNDTVDMIEDLCITTKVLNFDNDDLDEAFKVTLTHNHNSLFLYVSVQDNEKQHVPGLVWRPVDYNTIELDMTDSIEGTYTVLIKKDNSELAARRETFVTPWVEGYFDKNSIVLYDEKYYKLDIEEDSMYSEDIEAEIEDGKWVHEFYTTDEIEVILSEYLSKEDDDWADITEEESPEDDDWILMEKADDGAKRKVKKSNIGGTGGSTTLWYTFTIVERISTSVFTVTDNEINQSIFITGRPLRYRAEGEETFLNYGIIESYNSGTVTIAGATLPAVIVEMQLTFRRAEIIAFHISGGFSTVADDYLIKNYNNRIEQWLNSTAYIVKVSHRCNIDDSGASQPRGNINIIKGSALSFTGTGLNDCEVKGIYTGVLAVLPNFRFQIDGNGNPNTMKISIDGGSTWLYTNVPITTSWSSLGSGGFIRFGALTGHTLDDHWDFQITSNKICSANSSAGRDFAEYCVDSEVDINISNYKLEKDNRLECCCDANGSNDDAKDADFKIIIVYE